MNDQGHTHRSFSSGLWGLTLSGIILFMACQKIEPARIIKVKTELVSDIQYASSIVSGKFVDIPENGLNEHGHCWSTAQNPSIDGPHSTLGSRTTTGSFQSSLQGLSPGTLYYVRAYGQGGGEVSYGESISFTTLAAELPTVQTFEASEVRMNSALCSGDISADGGYTVTERGICWSTSSPPSPEDNAQASGSGPGDFQTTLTGLIPKTTYYVKAYAKNALGTNLGNEIVFTTSDLPSVSTVEIANVKPSSITCTGVINDEGGTPVISRGFCWDVNPEPTVDGASIESGNGPGEFEETITELTSATEFFIRAYATNINGTVYGDQFAVITPFVDTRNLTTYSVAHIGEQYWMAENLNYGTYIPSSSSQYDNEVVEKYCYDDNEANCDVYGGYYTWSEMMQYVEVESARGVCPDGWHLPSDEEWKTLEMVLGMTREMADGEDWRGTEEGGKLKLAGTVFWEPPNAGATNESGFSALPGGYYDLAVDDRFEGEGITATFWTSSKAPSDFTAYYRHLDYTTAKIWRSPGYMGNRTPVRCVKD